MAFQRGTSAASDGCRDILTSLTAFLTSQHISAAVLNAAGTGYVAGDTLTITHAGAYLDCKIEVLTVGGSGEILTFVIRDHGAFSNRVATVALGAAAGTGYAANDVVRLTTGTFTEFCKVRVDTVSSGVPTAVSVYETGGAYTSAPDASNGATNSDIGTGSGTGLQINTTMTGLIGTTAISATGGTGSGATFDLTLTATGWSAIEAAQNRNDYSPSTTNPRTDEKELVLQGTVSGGDDPYVGIRSYRGDQGVDTRYGWLICGMDSFNPGLALSGQPNVGPEVEPTSNGGVCLLMFDDDQDWWIQADGRQFKIIIKAVGASVTTYQSAYAGLLNPFGTQTEVPYPMYLSGSTCSYIRAPDSGSNFVTGLTELRSDLESTSPAFFRRASDAEWTRLENIRGTASRSTNVLAPVGSTEISTNNSSSEYLLSNDGNMEIHCDHNNTGTISREGGGAATQVLMPTIGDNELVLFPCTVLSTPTGTQDNNSETQIRGELSGVFWHGATKSDGTSMAAEDTVDISGKRHYIFQNAHRTERYSYFAIAAE